MGSTRVFISSAMDELEYDREIAASAIRSLNLEAVLFEGLAPISKPLEDAYLDEVRNCDIFVLILWKSLRPAVEREYQLAVREQKPILMLVKMLKEGEEREEKLKTFLGKVKDSTETNATNKPVVWYYKEYRRVAELESFLRDGITAQIENRLRATITTTHTREEMYQLGTKIVDAAKKRLYVVQRTPVFLLGAREYHAPDTEKVWYEVELYRALMRWPKRYLDKDAPWECVYLYDREATRQEMERYNLQECVRKHLSEVKQLERQSQYRFRALSMPHMFSGPMAIGDDWFAIWLIGEHDAACISHVNAKMANELINVLKPAGSRRIAEEELLKELGLQ